MLRALAIDASEGRVDATVVVNKWKKETLQKISQSLGNCHTHLLIYEQMFPTLAAAQNRISTLARDLDTEVLSGDEAERALYLNLGRVF